jgi:hypothetical protein
MRQGDSLAGAYTSYLGADPVEPKDILPSSEPLADEARIRYALALNDEVRDLMRTWSSHAAAKASADHLRLVVDRVSVWMHDMAKLRRESAAGNRPTAASLSASVKVGKAIRDEFRKSLAWLAPLKYAKTYLPTQVAYILANPSRLPSVLMENIRVIASLAFAPIRYVVRGGTAAVKVAAEVAKDVATGAATGGQRIIGTLDALTRNLTLIAVAGLAAYLLLPQLTKRS